MVTRDFPHFVENKNKFNEKTFLRVTFSCHIFVIAITGGVTGDFFRGTPDRIMCPEVDSASESEYQGFLLR